MKDFHSLGSLVWSAPSSVGIDELVGDVGSQNPLWTVASALFQVPQPVLMDTSLRSLFFPLFKLVFLVLSKAGCL